MENKSSVTALMRTFGADYAAQALTTAMRTRTTQYIVLGAEPDNLTERLLAAGFDRTAKTFFSWLGVTYYLSEAAIDKTLAEISNLCAEGSTLVFDYPDEHFFAAAKRRVQNTIAMANAGGEPMQTAFAYGALEKLLEKHGFLIYELLTPKEIQAMLIDTAGAELKAFEHINYCLAVKKS